MDTRIKYRWTEALRSGDYKQTTGELHQQNKGFCCLGVLCEIAAKDGVVDIVIDNGSYGYGNDQDREFAVLPKAVLDWSGLTTTNGEFKDSDGRISSLIRLNDSDHLSFAEIADVIEDKF